MICCVPAGFDKHPPARSRALSPDQCVCHGCQHQVVSKQRYFLTAASPSRINMQVDLFAADNQVHLFWWPGLIYKISYHVQHFRAEFVIYFFYIIVAEF